MRRPPALLPPPLSTPSAQAHKRMRARMRVPNCPQARVPPHGGSRAA